MVVVKDYNLVVVMVVCVKEYKCGGDGGACERIRYGDGGGVCEGIQCGGGVCVCMCVSFLFGCGWGVCERI